MCSIFLLIFKMKENPDLNTMSNIVTDPWREFLGQFLL